MPSTFPGDEHRIGFIYLIICKPTARAYVGQSKSPKSRWMAHRTSLRKGVHHSPALQEEWRAHGEESFMFAIVERRVDMVFLYGREQFWMWRFDGRLLNASTSAHTDRSHTLRQGVLKSYSDEELLAELARRGLSLKS